ncbi:MAG TPA: hypothetical protein VHK88_14495 [Aquihabitans sp.]|nr:hypothetical protein [Aquihabitans sp.]
MAAGLAATACTPVQLEIDISVRRHAVLDLRGAQPTLTLTAVIGCSGGGVYSNGKPANDGEPLDTWGSVESGNATIRAGEGGMVEYQSCSGEPRVRTLTWELSGTGYEGFTDGPATVRVDACTNPGEPIDEDCESDVDDEGTLTVLR